MLKHSSLKSVCWLVFSILWALPALADVDTAWVRRYNGPGDSTDHAKAIAVDGSGNVYVTGYSYDSVSSYDYATIKYYPNGDTAWVRRYNGPVAQSDRAYAMVVDGSGNIYVTGESKGSGTYYDYATVKYSTFGYEHDAKRYNGPGNGKDAAYAIALDDSGNVYVTGESKGSGTESDYATIKYYPSGDTAWARRYNGPGNYLDRALAIAVDRAGNVYVTGESEGSGTSRDYATIKYYLNGDTAWIRRYNGPGNAFDLVKAIVVDGSGNVYVTGGSYDSVSGYDYTTIKYYPDGDTAWVRRFDSGTAWAMAVDDSGNVYVTGQSFPDGDCTTIKYYPTGDTAWVRRYEGPSTSACGNAIAVNGSGNIYVTGWSSGTGLMIDYATVNYDPNGNELWVQRYNGPGNYNLARAIAVDGAGNVYVTGESEGIGTHRDYVTIKYVQNGSDVKDETGSREKPSEFTLFQSHPNPFNQSTKIEFALAKSGFVSLSIYDVLGRRVRTLVSERLSPGYKSVLWDAKNGAGNDVASGVYFYQLRVGGFSESRKLVLLK